MKIAFIVNQFPSLSETFILNQITGLIDRGHEVDIYANQPGDTIKIHSNVLNYSLLERTYYVGKPNNRLWRGLKAFNLLFMNFWRNPIIIVRSLNIFKYGEISASLTLFYAVAKLLEKKSVYDIIHCHFAPNGVKGSILREIGVIQGNIVTTFHGYDVNEKSLMYNAEIYKLTFSMGDLYTTNTTFTGNKAIKLGCPVDKLIKLPVGLDLSQYTFQKRQLCPNETIKILTIARLVEKKGIEYSIKAIANVLKNYSNLEYQIVGDGPLRESLEKLAIELKVINKIKFLGWQTQDEVCQLYADSHIFILSSVTASNGDQEGQGLVLQEAQAMGLPILSTLHNGIPDGVLDGKSGFLVPERDVDALAEKLRYLVEHPESWGSMGLAGRKFVEEHYDINKLNNRLVEIYKNVSYPDTAQKTALTASVYI
ncbi:colanic acid biosynthesis glycosyltransferase WcaL [Komarekiella sp. 'clone 1']|uniref:Colanic acid biosynthesis glycosyltransferase WcaL n=1 Tax=Komarekiella delphini-convector SJRDD-AB1 TaxID=2593771 RepID=A0AA40VQZ1_9NOST|nr:glycosyltransferase [Komarekiella delphini-convector]MBD6616575.1 colanic acid biosynthesis glycosyltransferase WcaL [Komarekiella delphini-convector SJRDD-AB1]